MSLAALPQAARLILTHGSGYGQQPDRRPLVEVELAATGAGGLLLGNSVRTSVLVDSGADVTLLDGGLAASLGLNLADANFPKGSVGGVGAGGVPVAQASVKMSLCDKWVDVPVNFTLQPIKHVQLLGREGAFEALVVAFVHGQAAMFAAAA